MKTASNREMEQNMILFRINMLNEDSARILSEARNLSDISDGKLEQLYKDLSQLRYNLAAVRGSILNIIQGPENGASMFIQEKSEVLENLNGIKSKLEGIETILNPNSKLYN